MNDIILSQEQQKAIEKIDGASLLLAVPGSGKTTTLISRIGRMVYDYHISPEKILVITYTKNAAKDMQERFASLFNTADSKRIAFRTINSFCNSVVQEFSSRVGRPKPGAEFNVHGNVRKLFEKVYGEKYPDELAVRDIARAIAYIKNAMLSDEDIDAMVVDGYKVRDMYDTYIRYMDVNKKMDYDDQILFTHMLFKNNSLGLLDYYSDKYPYVLVDEAQDTSKLQHEVIRLLTKKYGNLFMVGDEDQSIYGFRAAYPEALVHFEDSYPGGEVFLLQTNYRSAKTVVKVASNVIENNAERHKKVMLASRNDAGMVSVRHFKYKMDQYEELCKELQDCQQKTAILYRNNESAVPFISYLERASIPYSCRGMSDDFFLNKVVQDAMNIIAFAFRPRSFDLLWKIWYKLDLRIKKEKFVEATHHMDLDHRQPIFSALYQQRGINIMQQKKIVELMHQFVMIRQNDNARDAIHRVRTEMRYQNASSEKLYTLEAMAFPNESVAEFRERFEAMGARNWDKLQILNANVILSTIHGSKGLEYDKVILIDAVDGVLPGDDGDIEEERRIFYVGITRARDELVLCEYNDYPSQFLREIEPRKKKVKAVVKKKPVLKKSFHPEGIAEGVLIKHKDYGTGAVEYVTKDSITINFYGVSKKLLYPHIFTHGIAEIVE